MTTIAHYLREAYIYAKRSPDPSTQLGALLYIPSTGNIILGCNHFPEGVKYTKERLQRPEKYKFIIHAEVDAITKAAKFCSGALQDSILYCPWFSCEDCAKVIAAVGIKEVVGHQQFFDRAPASWTESIEVGNTILDEAGVIRSYYDRLIEGIDILVNGVRWTC